MFDRSIAISARRFRAAATAGARRLRGTAGAAALAAALACLPARAQSPDASDWGHAGGDAAGQRWSAVAAIDRDNVAQLEVAWTYRTGELGRGLASLDRLAFDATPVLAWNSLYFATPVGVVVALDPATGRERWRHDARVDRRRPFVSVGSRGVAAWQDRGAPGGTACARRVFAVTVDARLHALDAATGRPCAAFGGTGTLDLGEGRSPAEVESAPALAPPTVFRDLVIVGTVGRMRAGASPARALVRAFDARTGTPAWSYVTPRGTAAARGAMSVDASRGLLFVPTSADDEDGSDEQSSALVALDVASGRLVWSRQLVHRDAWGFGLAAQPALTLLGPPATEAPVVLAATRTGMLFAFDRESGEPAAPVEERPAPGAGDGDASRSRTQPFSSLPPFIEPGIVTPADAWGLTFWDRARCRGRIEPLRNEGLFTPRDPRGSIIVPGEAAGVDWGSVAIDPRRQYVIAAVNQWPAVQFAGAGAAIRREPLRSPWGLPCTRPPWGQLVALDLRRQRVAWRVPLGSSEGFLPRGLPVRNFGMPNAGGPIVTAGKVVFVAAATDSYLRALDVESGRELWKHRLPAGGQATPTTYRAGRDPRQFVVVAAGGDGRLGTPRGDYVVAFALPIPKDRR